MTKQTSILIGASLFVVDLIQRAREIPAIILVEKLPGNYHAMTIPPIGIFLERSQMYNDALIQHELIHWQQYRERGTVFFYLDYLIGWLSGYDGHPMEIEARANENDFVKDNYTYSVRTGLANTLYDPDFRR